MNFKQPLPSEPAPRSVLGIPANAGIQWSPKSAYFWWWFNDFLDAGLRQHDGYKVNGTAVKYFRY